MRKYYPKHKTSTRFSLQDLKYKHNNTPYTGNYIATSDGKFFAGSSNMSLGAELVHNNIKHKKNKSFSSRHETIKFNFRNPKIESTMSSYRSLPVGKPKPTSSDYKQGSFKRYFAQRINGNNYIELEEIVYNSIRTKDNTFDHNLYRLGFLTWFLTGDVYSANSNMLKKVNKQYPNIHYAFPILNEYSKPSKVVIEDQYTEGGNLYYGNGTEYIGHYHIHPVQGPMVGAKHSPQPHEKLYYFNQLPDFGTPYEDWLNNYNNLECYKCIVMNDTLNIVGITRSRLLGCVEDSYTTENEAAQNCPRVNVVEELVDEGINYDNERPNMPLEGGINGPIFLNNCGNFDYSGFDTTDTIGSEVDDQVNYDNNSNDGIHPPYGYGGGEGGGSDSGYGSSGGGYSGGGGASCFTPNTLITMADGTEKTISSIEVGDKVKSEIGESTVLNIQIHEGEYSVYSFNNGKPFVTAEHPFKTIDGWKAIDPISTFEKHQKASTVLNLQDIVYKLNGTEIISSIEKGFTTYPKVYNLSLDNEHVFYANEYLVHNTKEVNDPRVDLDPPSDIVGTSGGPY